ncbi:MAG TPA: histidinol dehydrogenase [Rhodanobacteraceae bacterium]|nr:histidinol dehydrogenase [Rhodanobacteraceae bacterium]
MIRRNWDVLDACARAELLARPALTDDAARRAQVADIIARVQRGGDAALRELTRQLDGVELADLSVSEAEFVRAIAGVPAALARAINDAKTRIEHFHRASLHGPVRVETAPGVVCESLPRPIQRVGLYVPAGSAPLPSTALMLGVPAQLAGCPDVVLCTPPRADGRVDAAVLYAAQLCGIRRVLKLGGAQAIAAMACGSASVPACDKLFGPGNAWVTEAKRQVTALGGGPAIDMPAGPSEVMVIADAVADPAFVAADLLSQCEHGPDSQAVLLSDDAGLLDAVALEVEAQVAGLPRAAIARASLRHARLLWVAALDTAFDVANAYAPEHLIVQLREPRRWLDRIQNAGSVFLGDYAPESLGDYCSGTNHVLPTYGHARAWSGVSVASFQKRISVQEVSAEGLRSIGPCAVTLAHAEGLDAHACAVSRRLEKLECSA